MYKTDCTIKQLGKGKDFNTMSFQIRSPEVLPKGALILPYITGMCISLATSPIMPYGRSPVLILCIAVWPPDP